MYKQNHIFYWISILYVNPQNSENVFHLQKSLQLHLFEPIMQV